jgi:hypothetical protein
MFSLGCLPISAISWRRVLVVEEDGVPGENHRPWASNWDAFNIVAARLSYVEKSY